MFDEFLVNFFTCLVASATKNCDGPGGFGYDRGRVGFKLGIKHKVTSDGASSIENASSGEWTDTQHGRAVNFEKTTFVSDEFGDFWTLLKVRFQNIRP